MSVIGLSWNLCLMLLVLSNVSEMGRGQDFLNPHECLNTGNYTANSTYNDNLSTALSALSSNTSRYGFYSASIGQQDQDNTVNAIALCRGDTRIDQCRSCVANAAIELVQLCPNQKQAIRWYEMCMLHFSNTPLNGAQTSITGKGLVNTAAVSNPVQFRQDRAVLMDALRVQAANGSSLVRVGAGSMNTSDEDTIYALLQCVPTLSLEDCNDCLILATTGLSREAQGARALRASCNLRYELYPFYNETRLRELNIMLLDIPNSGTRVDQYPTRGNKDGDKTKIVVAIVVPTTVLCPIILAAYAVFFQRKRAKKSANEIPQIMDEKRTVESTEKISTVESLQYDFRRISAATNYFADTNKLGEGGFGAVYRGILLNGREIAVKRLSSDSGQGDTEFKNEVMLLAKLQHRNLVKFIGFAQEGTERLLIYEFVPNGSLDLHIFDPNKSAQLDWMRRYKIIRGIARGLLYLHEDSRFKIIHRDLKPSNILLDEEMNPKVADFGMARLFGTNDQSQGSTSNVVGTYGYMPPEYAIYGQFSAKSDVYSFGVLVLEIVSGQPMITSNEENTEDLLSFVWRNWCEGTAEHIIDLVLKAGQGSVHDKLKCIHIGLLCVQEDVADRPEMTSIGVMLSSSTVTLPVPSRPAFVMSTRVGSSFSASGKDGSTEYLDLSNESKVKA